MRSEPFRRALLRGALALACAAACAAMCTACGTKTPLVLPAPASGGSTPAKPAGDDSSAIRKAS